jgi:hypothetical protein
MLPRSTDLFIQHQTITSHFSVQCTSTLTYTISLLCSYTVQFYCYSSPTILFTSNGDSNISTTVVVLAKTVTCVDSSLDLLSFDPHTSVVAWLLLQKRQHQSSHLIQPETPVELLVSKECSNFTDSGSFSTLFSSHYFSWVLLQHSQQLESRQSIKYCYFYPHSCLVLLSRFLFLLYDQPTNNSIIVVCCSSVLLACAITVHHFYQHLCTLFITLRLVFKAVSLYSIYNLNFAT